MDTSIWICDFCYRPVLSKDWFNQSNQKCIMCTLEMINSSPNVIKLPPGPVINNVYIKPYDEHGYYIKLIYDD